MTKDQLRIEAMSEQLENGCWMWLGSKTKVGYGLGYSSKEKKLVSAHRLAFAAFKGEIPQGMVVAHACDNPLCVNPDHLWLATHAENSADMVKKGRSAKGEKCGKSKLTEEQVKFIRESNLSQRQLGAMFGVSHANIGYIKRGFTWN